MDPAPLEPATYAVLRAAVSSLRMTTRARVFAPEIHVGLPDGEQSALLAPSRPVHMLSGEVPPDHALRTDLVSGLLRMQHEDTLPAVWLTRVGFPQMHDLDLAWWAAARTAFAEAAVPLPWFVVLTKSGWHRPATGEQRTWQRLRLR
jgi:hypothetical protein